MIGVPGQLLAQTVGTTTGTAVYTANIDTEITRIVIANTTASAVTFRLWIDRTGSGSYTSSNALAWDISVAAGDRFVEASFPGSGYVIEAGARLAFSTSVGSSLTLSLFGYTDNVHGTGMAVPGR